MICGSVGARGCAHETRREPAVTISIDGKLVAQEDARIDIFDHGLLYGDGVFEGMRMVGRGIFRLDDHMRRLGAGAKHLGLELPGGLARMRQIAIDTCKAHEDRDAYIRFVVTRGSGPLGVDPFTCKSPVVICIVSGITLFPADKRARGLDMVTSSVRKPDPDQLDPRVKSLNYLNSVLAKREARMRNVDEALVLNKRGTVAEASVANIFIVRQGSLQTPPTTDGSLEGITRRSVMEIAGKLGIPCQEKSLSRADVLDADECFLSGTGARIVAVATLDGAAIGTGERPVMAKIDTAFDAFQLERGVKVD